MEYKKTNKRTIYLNHENIKKIWTSLQEREKGHFIYLYEKLMEERAIDKRNEIEVYNCKFRWLRKIK